MPPIPKMIPSFLSCQPEVVEGSVEVVERRCFFMKVISELEMFVFGSVVSKAIRFM